jgi:hypothetical protein
MDKRNADICVSLARRSEYAHLPELHLNQQREQHDDQLHGTNSQHVSDGRERSSVGRLGCESKLREYVIESERYDIGTIRDRWFDLADETRLPVITHDNLAVNQRDGD